MYSYVIIMSLLCTCMSSVCHSYVLMPSVCHSYVLVCHPYLTRMSLACTRMSLVCTHMSSVCYSYVLVCHPYVTRMWFYHEPVATIQNVLSFCRKSTFLMSKSSLIFDVNQSCCFLLYSIVHGNN